MRKASRETVKNKNHLPSEITKKNTGPRNRVRGHNYERKIAKEFRDLGFTRCLTTRQASRLWDDCKLDLYGIPVNVQLKNVISSMNYVDILNSMISKVTEFLPEREDKPFIIFHKKGKEELAIMYKEDLYKLLVTLLLSNGTNSSS